MIFDTDILVWVQRQNPKAAEYVQAAERRFISIQTYMEILQGARSPREMGYSKNFLLDMGFVVLPFTENIGHRAAIYIEEYALSSGLRAGDAIIASTAVEHNRELVTGNTKHFKSIRDLKLRSFTA